MKRRRSSHERLRAQFLRVYKIEPTDITMNGNQSQNVKGGTVDQAVVVHDNQVNVSPVGDSQQMPVVEEQQMAPGDQAQFDAFVHEMNEISEQVDNLPSYDGKEGASATLPNTITYAQQRQRAREDEARQMEDVNLAELDDGGEGPSTSSPPTDDEMNAHVQNVREGVRRVREVSEYDDEYVPYTEVPVGKWQSRVFSRVVAASNPILMSCWLGKAMQHMNMDVTDVVSAHEKVVSNFRLKERGNRERVVQECAAFLLDLEGVLRRTGSVRLWRYKIDTCDTIPVDVRSAYQVIRPKDDGQEVESAINMARGNEAGIKIAQYEESLMQKERKEDPQEAGNFQFWSKKPDMWQKAGYKFKDAWKKAKGFYRAGVEEIFTSKFTANNWATDVLCFILIWLFWPLGPIGWLVFGTVLGKVWIRRIMHLGYQVFLAGTMVLGAIFLVLSLLWWLVRGRKKSMRDECWVDEAKGSVRDEDNGFLLTFTKYSGIAAGGLGFIMLPFIGIEAASHYARAGEYLVKSSAHFKDMLGAIQAFLTGLWKARTSPIVNVYYVDPNQRLCVYTCASTDEIPHNESKHMKIFWNAKDSCWMTATFQAYDKGADSYVVVSRNQALLVSTSGALIEMIERAKKGLRSVTPVCWDEKLLDYVPMKETSFPVQQLPDEVGSFTKGMLNWAGKLVEDEDGVTAPVTGVVTTDSDTGVSKIQPTKGSFQPNYTYERPDPDKTFCHPNGTRAFEYPKQMGQECKQLQKLAKQKNQKNVEFSAEVQQAAEEAKAKVDAYDEAFARYASGKRPYWSAKQLAAKTWDVRVTHPMFVQGATIPGSMPDKKGKEKEKDPAKVESVRDADPKFKDEGFSETKAYALQQVKEFGAFVRKQCCSGALGFFNAWVLKWKLFLFFGCLIICGLCFYIFTKYSKKQRKPWKNQSIQDWTLKYGDGKEMEFEPRKTVYIQMDEGGQRVSYKGTTDDSGNLDVIRMLSARGHLAGRYNVNVLMDLGRNAKNIPATLTLKHDLKGSVRDMSSVPLQLESKEVRRGGASVRARRADAAAAITRRVKNYVDEALGNKKEETVPPVAAPMTPLAILQHDIEGLLSPALPVEPMEDEAVELASIREREVEMINQAYIALDQGARYLYACGDSRGQNVAVAVRIRDCLVTKEHVVDALEAMGCGEMTVHAREQKSFASQIPFVRKDWVKIRGMRDTVAIPLPKKLCAMAALRVTVVPDSVKSCRSKFITMNAQTQMCAMDTVDASVSFFTGQKGEKLREAIYESDHLPGISGSTLYTDTNPPECYALHAAGNAKSLKCCADMFSFESIKHLEELSLASPAMEAVRRFANSLN